MRPVVLLLIFVALLFSGFSAFMAKKIMSEKPPEIALDEKGEAVRAEPMTEVLVAANNIEVGKIVKNSDLRWQKWPKAATNKDFVVGGGKELRSSFVGMMANTDITKGEPVKAAMFFEQDTAGFMSGLVSPGMRAYGIQVSTKIGMTGFIFPGDRVDVLLIAKLTASGVSDMPLVHKMISETVLTNIRVLAVDNKVISPNSSKPEEDGKKKKKKEKAKAAKTMTLEVTPRQAQILALAQKMGSIALVLRPLSDFSQGNEGAVGYSSDLDSFRSFDTVIRGGSGGAVSMPFTPSDNARGSVKIYRGGEMTVQSATMR